MIINEPLLPSARFIAGAVAAVHCRVFEDEETGWRVGRVSESLFFLVVED